MSKNGKNSEVNYYSGGLAELVPSPSVLTYSFLKHWFTGNGSIGRAMKILGLPYTNTNLSILKVVDGDLLVNLINEEETLYSKTIFTYKKQKHIHDVPGLGIHFHKVISPVYLFNTCIMLLAQSKWIAHPKNSVLMAEKLIKTIPEEIQNESIIQTDLLLQDKVWPVVTAVGMLSEFYNQFLTKEVGENFQTINTYISNQVTKDDWFFRSIADQEAVKKNTLSFSDYIKKYGIRADKDYELTSPRWNEIPEVIEKRIQNYINKNNNHVVQINLPNNVKKIVDAVVQLQVLRSEAKRKALIFIDHLRKKIVEKTKNRPDMGQLTREEILANQLPKFIKQNKTFTKEKKENILHSLSGKGIPVSRGIVTGVAKHIISNHETILDGTIGIFPNASPEFAIQYPKCVGMIFLRGGQTSHGAIVAREFGIPALIDHKAGGIKDGAYFEIDGVKGEWRITSRILS